MSFLKTIYLLLIPVIVFSHNFSVRTNRYHQTKKRLSSEAASPCPAKEAINRTQLKDFLVKPSWKPQRQETNTGHLTTSQITLLSSPDNNSTCKKLNKLYQGFISETWANGEKSNNLTYYKVGNFYFVIISPKPPKDPQIVVTGPSYIGIYNNNLKKIKGYYFGG